LIFLVINKFECHVNDTIYFLLCFNSHEWQVSSTSLVLKCLLINHDFALFSLSITCTEITTWPHRSHVLSISRSTLSLHTKVHVPEAWFLFAISSSSWVCQSWCIWRTNRTSTTVFWWIAILSWSSVQITLNFWRLSHHGCCESIRFRVLILQEA